VASIAIAITPCIASCSSPPPGSVDRETLAADIGSCARLEPACVRRGDVKPAEAIVPGQGHAVSLFPGATIDLAFTRPSPTAKLVHLAIGMRSAGSLDDVRKIAVAVTGGSETVMTPPISFSRVEIAQLSFTPPEDARLRITSLDGKVDILYVVGRWKD